MGFESRYTTPILNGLYVGLDGQPVEQPPDEYPYSYDAYVTYNKHSPTVIIAAITSKANIKAKLPTHYYLDAGNGLALPSLVLLEQIRTVDKRRLSDYIGRLNETYIRGINHALAVSIGLIEPVPPKLTLCLCGACANAFRGTGAFVLREAVLGQAEKEICVYCHQRSGTEYEVSPIGGRGRKS